MALIPQPTGTKPAAGYPGMWANMEECNSFSAFAESSFGFGVPLAKGTGDMGVVPLTTGNRFIGISLSNVYTTGTPSNGDERYGVGDLLGVADEGVIFVRAGASVTKGALAYYDTATGKFHGASAAGRLPIPNAEFDGAAADGEVAPLRIRIVPGSANVTAAT